MNFLMIFGLIFSGITGVFSIYFANASDIIDCAYSSKNIGSDNPRVIPRTTDKSVMTRCIRGDGNLLDEYLSDNARKVILSLKKINTIYTAIIDAYKRMHSGENVYNTLNSIEQVIQDFKFMKDEFSLTTSKKEHGENDITSMLNELNRYTFAGMKYQPICEDDASTYDVWTLRPLSSPTIQSVEGKEITNYNIITLTSTSITSRYDGVCDLINDPPCSTAKIGATNYINSLITYYNLNRGILDKMITETSKVRLNDMKTNFENNFIINMKETIKKIKEKIADPFWDVFGELVNDKTNYAGVEDAEKVDIFGWLNCSVLGKDYNITMNTIKTTFVTDLKIVTYCSLIFEGLIIALYFIIISLANNIRDKEFEKNENKYDIESKKDDGEIFEIVPNNKYKDKYEFEGDLITFSKKHKNKSKGQNKNNTYITTNEDILNYQNDKTNNISMSNEEILKSVKKDLPQSMITVPKIDVAENIEAIKNVDMRKLVDKQGKAVMHPIRLAINSPLGVMEASDKYAHKYTYDIFEPVKEDDSENNNSGIDNGSFYQNNKKDKKDQKDKKKKGKDKDKKSNKSSEFSF